MIKLFKKDETNFSHDGIEILDDIVISSYTSWSENSKWVNESKFKKDFDKSELLKEDMILQLPTEKGPQLFRILKINKKNKKYITATGQALGFDFENNFIQDINIVDKSGRAAMEQIQGGTSFNNKFNLSSNIDVVSSARMVRKNGITALLGSEDNTFVNRWGGYLVLDNFNIAMNKSVGEDRGVEILVGKNLTDMEGTIDISNVCTGINAITYDGLTLPEGIYYSPLLNNYSEPHIKEFKFSDIKYKYSENNSDEEGYETLEEVYAAIRVECDKLFNESDIDKPTCNLRVSIVDLAQTDQFKGDEINERIFQGDILTANLEEYGFNVKLKMTANKYDNVKDKYDDIDLGDLKNNIFNTISNVQNTVDKVVEQLGGNSWQDILDKSMQEATQLIEAGIKDSYVVARKNEILIMDNPLVESAINVIRMNKNGIAFSQNGYNGPYTLAITIDGKINASCITTGELNAALIKTGTIMSANGNLAISIDEDYLQVTHTESDSKTRIDAEGFSILDGNGDVLAWLSNKKQWTELNVDKVFAGNILNLYQGPGTLYVNHSFVGNSDGSSTSPFSSFADLQSYLLATPIINKDLTIYIYNPGFEITEQFCLYGLSGAGYLAIYYDANVTHRIRGGGGVAIRMYQIKKYVMISGGRSGYNSTNGALICDDGNGHGINVADIDCLYVGYISINCKNWGLVCERTRLYNLAVDFGKCYNAVELRDMSIYYMYDCCGGNTDFCRVKSGSFAIWGDDSNGIRPKGNVQASKGAYYSYGSGRTVTDSYRFPTASATPSVPATSNYTQSFSWTSHKTYAYSWSNWGDDDCKQGSWGYGLRGGHMFFDIAAIRSFLSGTVQDGNSITLTRASSGGLSGASNVYINGSTCSSASGTPGYSNQTWLGTLSWGETKTFTLPKAIVDTLKSGTCSSLAVYVNSTEQSNYINIVNCSISLKVNK